MKAESAHKEELPVLCAFLVLPPKKQTLCTKLAFDQFLNDLAEFDMRFNKLTRAVTFDGWLP